MKIYSLKHLRELGQKAKEEKKKIVLCHGHFNVIHPGHLRFLNFAKKQGDILVVSIVRDQDLEMSNKDDYFTQEDRAEGVAALQCVDAVYPIETNIVDLINEIRPDFYIKGREFETRQELIQDEITAIKKNKGKVIFSSGEVEYSTLKISDFVSPKRRICQKKEEFLSACAKQDISLGKIKEAIDGFSKLKMVVIGDTIVDQFISCDTLGVSSEAPVLAIRELESKEFIGGAAIIARHIKSLGADCTFISVIGEDHTGDYVRKNLEEAKIKTLLLSDSSRPTTFKMRYMVDNQKLLRVSRLKQHMIDAELEAKIMDYISNLEGIDGLIISDFVYGVITPKVLWKIVQTSREKGFKVFGDVQCSSQVGDVTKFQGIHLITPTEKEARIGLADQTSGLEALAQNLIQKTRNQNVVITLGSQGILAYAKEKNHNNVHSEYFPALEANPVDVAGAGDSVMSGYALGLCLGMNLMEATAFASALAGIAVTRIGNIPITPDEIKTYLTEIMNYRNNE